LLPTPREMGIKKRQRYPYIIRTPLPVIVLSDYRERGKTYPTSTEAFSNPLDPPLSEKR